MKNAQCTMHNAQRITCIPSAARCPRRSACVRRPAAAQDVRLLSTKVADVLAQFPAGAPADRDKLAAEILGLGEPGLAAIVKQLVTAGAGSDTAARFALNAVAVVASRRARAPAAAGGTIVRRRGGHDGRRRGAHVPPQPACARRAGRGGEGCRPAARRRDDARARDAADAGRQDPGGRRRAAGRARRGEGPRPHHDRQGARRTRRRGGQPPRAEAGRRRRSRPAPGGVRRARPHREPGFPGGADRGGEEGWLRLRAGECRRRRARVREAHRREGIARDRRERVPAADARDRHARTPGHPRGSPRGAGRRARSGFAARPARGGRSPATAPTGTPPS